MTFFSWGRSTSLVCLDHWQGLLCINQSTNQLTVTFVGVTRVQKKMNQKGSLGAGGYNM
jgi:hypothetical protein